MPTAADLIDAIMNLRESIDKLHEATRHLEVISFDEEQFLRIAADLTGIPKLNLARAVDAERFRILCNLANDKACQLKVGAITRAQLDDVRDLTATIAFVANSATYPIFEQIDDLEDPPPTEDEHL